MTSCEKATMICTKAQYEEATFIEKVTLKMHILVCKSCSKFSKENTEFTSLCDKAISNSLSESEKQEMKEKLQQK